MNRVVLASINNVKAITTHCTHLCVPFDCITEFGTKPYEHKCEQRQIKTLLVLDSNNVERLGCKHIIKNMIEYGYDGFVLDNVNSYNMINVTYLVSSLYKLPSPYNINWQIFCKFDGTDEVLSCYKTFKKHMIDTLIHGNIVRNIKFMTDNQFDPNTLIIPGEIENCLHTIKYNKLGGVFCEDNSEIFFKGLQKTLDKSENTVEYPTSEIIVSKNIDNILDLYFTPEITSKSLDDVHITIDISLIQ
jgi:hypothetical protein